MPLRDRNGIRYFHFEGFDSFGVTNAVFTRRGGVSPAPWSSLNVGGSVGDDPERVAENRRRSLSALPGKIQQLAQVWQVHGAAVQVIDGGETSDGPYPRADILLTDRPGVALFMRFADCVPLLLYDPVRGVTGLVHTGWRGTVLGAARTAVQEMERHYGSRPEQLLAAIGPSIGPDHYVVGADVVEAVRSSFGKAADAILLSQDQVVHLDLWRANQLTLETAGVTQIELAGLCTACHPEDWYSHRGEKGKTGRFGALIVQS